MKYIGPDFCNITASLSDEELLIQKTANEFVSQEFLPIVNEYYEKGSFPLDLIPKMGEIITNDRASYQYLVESIRKFPDQETFLGMVKSAGFENAKYRNLTLGIACLHSGWKI